MTLRQRLLQLGNPLDWPQLERMMLLASLILISPVLIIGGLMLLYWQQPQVLNVPVALGYGVFLAVYALCLTGFIWLAWRARRKQQQRWVFMERFVIFSYLTMILVGSWLTGTPFTVGLLLLIVGCAVAAPLVDVRRLKRAYLLSFPFLGLFLIMQLSGRFEHAPLFTTTLFHADGSPKNFWLLVQIFVVVIVLGMLSLLLEATGRWEHREAEYRELSIRDSLTQLSNRRTFMNCCEIEWQRCQRKPDDTLSCILLDVDHFKQVNDTHGHQAGDAVLVALARILQGSARQYDEVGRYGGEEFILLLPSTPLGVAVAIAERLRAKVAATRVKIDEKALMFTASFGVAAGPTPAITDVHQLIKTADAALYAAKHAGRNRVMTEGDPIVSTHPG